MDAFVDVIAIISLPGIVFVGVVPALLGVGMAALLVVGLVEPRGVPGNRDTQSTEDDDGGTASGPRSGRTRPGRNTHRAA